MRKKHVECGPEREPDSSEESRCGQDERSNILGKGAGKGQREDSAEAMAEQMDLRDVVRVGTMSNGDLDLPNQIVKVGAVPARFAAQAGPSAIHGVDGEA